MAWFNSIETLSKLIPIAQILIVLLTVFTIWATIQSRNLEKLEKTKLSDEIAQTKSETAELTKKNIDLHAELRESSAALTHKNIELEADLKESKIKLGDLKMKTEPRSLLPEQKTKLAQLLPAPSNFQVTAACRMMDTESCNFAEELIGVFRELKWKTGTTNKTFLGDIPSDVVVAITEDAQIPTAEKILKALNNAGLKSSNEPIPKGAFPGGQDNTIYLFVGAKKQNP